MNRKAGRIAAKGKAESKPAEPRAYTAPALEKGIDILELLAEERRPLSLRQIGERLGRSKSELFRMIMVLQSRGYIAREAAGDAFILTPRLFELGMRTPRVRELLDAAVPEMRRLAEETRQSAHLVVLSQGETVVVASISGGSDMSFSLRPGYRRPLTEATSGRVILAFQPPEAASRWIAEARPRVGAGFDADELEESLARIRRQGFEIHASRDVVGITDIGCPVFGEDGSAAAALVVPYVNRVEHRTDAAALLEAARRAAAAISSVLGGGAPAS